MANSSYRFAPLGLRSTLARLDLYPFLLLYALLYALMHYEAVELLYAKLLFLVCSLLNAFVYICGEWSPLLRARIRYSPLPGPLSAAVLRADCVEVRKVKENSQVVELCDLLLQEDEAGVRGPVSFFFKHQKFVFDEDKSQFVKLKPRFKGLPLSRLVKQALGDKAGFRWFQKNELEVPIPRFWDLVRRRVIQPFTFFQFVSSLIWLMDNRYVYIFTSLIFMGFASINYSVQKIRNLVAFRSLSLQPYMVHCYRDRVWKKVSSKLLLPSDIVIVERGDRQVKDPSSKRLSDSEFLTKQLPVFARGLARVESATTDSLRNVGCDLLLLSGSCVVDESILTGQSVPQVKDSISQLDLDETFRPDSFKGNMLFCGTQVVQISEAESHPEWLEVSRQPVPGALAMVVKTGFDTSKGKLIRSVVTAYESPIEDRDSLWLVIILLVIAVLASCYVLYFGSENEALDKEKLFLRCILIVTTVVPPQLPMIVSIAVNNSIAALIKKKIYCTESHKIPVAGKVGMVAFDKTGTLTSDALVLEGFVEDTAKAEVVGLQELSMDSQVVLAGCHSLVVLNKKYQGDPIEKLFFKEGDWDYNSDCHRASSRKVSVSVDIRETFPFRSELKRMSTVVQLRKDGKLVSRLLVKGAPEVIRTLLEEVPCGYDAALEHYSQLGYRVLTLAFRDLQPKETQTKSSRLDLERGLKFAGLMVCKSQLKEDTKEHIDTLRAAGFEIVMITGDNILTAVNVGEHIGMGTVRAVVRSNNGTVELVVGKGKPVQLRPDSEVKPEWITATEQVSRLPTWALQKIKIFARTTPAQKEKIVSVFKTTRKVMFCGDGTNDVSGLKAADAGLAIAGARERRSVDVVQEQSREKVKQLQKQIKDLTMNTQLGFMQKINKMKELKTEQMKLMGGQPASMGLEEEEPELKPGDACIAAPFTSKHSSSIYCVVILLRQSICVLANSIQIYGYVTISSIMHAFTLACMNIEGLRYSNAQMMLSSVVGIYCFYQLTNARPLKALPTQRPPPTIFCASWLVSTVGQVLVYSFAIFRIYHLAKPHSAIIKDEDFDLDLALDQELPQFTPNFMNTAIFLQELLTQSAVFLFNNGGAPYFEGLSQSPGKLKILLVTILGPLLLSRGFFPELGELLGLTFEGVPKSASDEVSLVLLVVFAGGYLFQRLGKWLEFGRFLDWV